MIAATVMLMALIALSCVPRPKRRLSLREQRVQEERQATLKQKGYGELHVLSAPELPLKGRASLDAAPLRPLPRGRQAGRRMRRFDLSAKSTDFALVHDGAPFAFDIAFHIGEGQVLHATMRTPGVQMTLVDREDSDVSATGVDLHAGGILRLEKGDATVRLATLWYPMFDWKKLWTSSTYEECAGAAFAALEVEVYNFARKLYRMAHEKHQSAGSAFAAGVGFWRAGRPREARRFFEQAQHWRPDLTLPKVALLWSELQTPRKEISQRALSELRALLEVLEREGGLDVAQFSPGTSGPIDCEAGVQNLINPRIYCGERGRLFSGPKVAATQVAQLERMHQKRQHAVRVCERYQPTFERYRLRWKKCMSDADLTLEARRYSVTDETLYSTYMETKRRRCDRKIARQKVAWFTETCLPLSEIRSQAIDYKGDGFRFTALGLH